MVYIKKYIFLCVTVIVRELNLTEGEIDKVHFAIRKTAHFTEYLILSFLVTVTYSEFYNKRLNVSLILLVCILVAINDEFLQSFIEGRSSQVKDVLIDFSGSLFQLFIFLLMRSRLNKGLKKNKYRW